MISAVPATFSQSAMPTPRQEKLLNGLKVLMWSDSTSDKVTVKIRIHSGSAFDPQGKEGVMQLLADNLFPNQASRDFFAEDLGGGLDIVTNYDYIQINASSKPEGFLTMLETLATAVSNTSIDKETTLKLRNALLAKLKIKESDPAYVADQAVAKRLLGTFPYGRPQMGSTASVQKIDFADLIDAKQRFLTADNATIAISGNFDKVLGFKAVRRYFGGWLKADKRVPATFRQPDDPDTKLLRIEMPDIQKSYSRSATNAPARNDKEYYSMLVFVSIRHELRCRDAGKYQANFLRGLYISSDDRNIGELPTNSGPCPIGLIRKGDGSIMYPEISQDDFERAKSRIIGPIQGQVSSSAGLADIWLDVDTYRLISSDDEIRKASAVALSDVKSLAKKIYKSTTVNIVLSAP